MGRTWKIWWHPRRARRELERVEEELASQTDKMSAMLTRMSEMTAQNDNLARVNEQNKDRISKLEEAVMNLTNELLKTRRQLDEKSVELAQSAIDQVQLQQFIQRLDEVEAMKAKYEQRIDRLRAKVIELQNTGAQKPPVLHFDNNEENRTQSSMPQLNNRRTDSKSDNPQISATKESGTKESCTKGAGNVETGTKEVGSDWLQSLPDE